jgi:hypothetical protein
MEPTTSVGGACRLNSQQWPAKSFVRVACQRGQLFLGPNVATSLVDASEEVIGILTRESLAAGERVSVSLEGVGHATPFERLGRVAWCDPAEDGTFRAGVELETPLEYAELASLCTR